LRIVSALVELHEEIGPARTTVSAVAERAGVERLTVYRHFPDEPSMLRACSAHWNALHPPPSIAVDGDEPFGVCRRAVLRLYRWYRANEAMLTRIHRDAESMPVVAELIAPFAVHLDRLAADLDRNWGTRSSRRSATIRHALDFSTWRSLDRITGSDARAAALVSRWVESEYQTAERCTIAS